MAQYRAVYQVMRLEKGFKIFSFWLRGRAGREMFESKLWWMDRVEWSPCAIWPLFFRFSSDFLWPFYDPAHAIYYDPHTWIYFPNDTFQWSNYFKHYKLQWPYGLVQFCCLLKIYLWTSNCFRNHVVAYTKRKWGRRGHVIVCKCLVLMRTSHFQKFLSYNSFWFLWFLWRK